MVYEWLYFAHQMLLIIGIRGGSHSLALERLRDHWATTDSPRSPQAVPR